MSDEQKDMFGSNSFMQLATSPKTEKNTLGFLNFLKKVLYKADILEKCPKPIAFDLQQDIKTFKIILSSVIFSNMLKGSQPIGRISSPAPVMNFR